MTAVEWLEEEIKDLIPNDIGSQLKFKNKVKKAKEMERQQIMTAFTQGDIFGADYFDGVNITEENYYNQTFKSE